MQDVKDMLVQYLGPPVLVANRMVWQPMGTVFEQHEVRWFFILKMWKRGPLPPVEYRFTRQFLLEKKDEVLLPADFFLELETRLRTMTHK